ncbi:MAG: MOSC domain-containing protein [Alicyclobacillus herbarius]|uniref:MOSC domain-containing protein n=1 Tax=Alicyclobacillus herbarius TaxID=122960 RepID=UPI002352001F|nr:MOSC domain-containing protein [Alicyclobacillus herbarius]MCL6634083.1 MOSC domain-containing protein [Alicyclobacillus herbarius]
MWKSRSVIVESVYIADQQNTFVTRSVSNIQVDYGGIPGDLHFGLTKRAGVREPMYPRGTEIFNRRQVTVVSMEECALIAEELGVPEVLPQWLGANIALRGFPNLTKLPVGSRIFFPSGAGLVCEGENLPCTQAGNMVQANYPDVPKLSSRFVRHALGRRGIICVVERPGKICASETAKVVIYNPPV